jgi:hypothetical protein
MKDPNRTAAEKNLLENPHFYQYETGCRYPDMGK